MSDEAIKIMKTMDEYKDYPDEVLKAMTIDDIKVGEDGPFALSDKCGPFALGDECEPFESGDKCEPFESGDECKPFVSSLEAARLVREKYGIDNRIKGYIRKGYNWMCAPLH